MGRVSRFALAVALAFAQAACVVHRLEVEPIDPAAATPITVTSPVRAHLKDGSTVVFEEGVTVENDTVSGRGQRFDLALSSSVAVASIPVEDIAAMESIATPLAGAASGFGSYGLAIAGSILALAIFGSCPTVYAPDATGTAVLEAESFSYSIAPLLEARDVDRLGIVESTLADGIVVLEIRNEALETHYLNHLELVEVVHSPQESVYPDPQGRPVIVGATVAAVKAADSAGRAITQKVATADGHAWTSADSRLRRATPEAYRDHVVLEFETDGATSELALVLRLRNSLLNTVLFYDVMLKDQGFEALDWLGEELNQIGPALELGRWYAQKMGMRVELWQDGEFVEVARISDQGPIAWKDVAVKIPAPPDHKARVRLSFVAGNWLIDRVAVSSDVRDATPRYVALAGVRGRDGEALDDARDRLSTADERYFITQPGGSIALRFDVGPLSGPRRTFLLAAQGYYVEWLRGDWLRSQRSTSFAPSDAALLAAMERWQGQRESFQKQFETMRIPTR